ncbi:centrosome-associated protein ALMS1 isoform X5 [Manis pentadactyla]|uniref:centrosome-associated protein ALMS1 isoform X5 n=1 Tax=Manis pentadactyla TaxID=143292 RepID=UPI00255D1384|nr:centrosome-associated protein ALMS1 isoform X5 [Manis pentadactyla]
MELEDLPWPGELEEEAEEGEEAENLDQDEVAVVMEEKEGEGRRKLASDLHCESRPLGSPDGEDDEEAKAWMRARPAGTVVPPSLPTFHRSEDQRPGPEKKTESWHRLPQEMDFSNTLDTTQTRFNRREEGTKVTDFPSLEEGLLTLSENRVKEPNRDLLCSPLLEGLQGKAESDICTLDDDSECCSLDENAVVCGNRVAELQREICVQGDLTGECIELAGLENLLDDLEICDSSLQLSSKEENSSEEPPTRKTEYHTSDLRMLRISPDSVPETLKHLPGVTSKGGISEIIQSKLKAGINTTPADSDTGSHLSFSSEDFPHLAVRSLQENTIGQLTDALNQQALADSQPTEGTLKVSAVHEIADQKTGISTVLSSSYSQRGKPSIFYPQASPYSRLAEEALKVSSAPGSAEQKTGIPIVSPTSYSFREKRGIFYRETWSDSHLTEQAEKASAAPGSAEQNTGISTTTSASYPHRERPSVLYQQQLPDSHLAGQAQTDSTVSGFADQKTGVPKETSTSYPHRERPSVSYQQELPDSHLAGQAQTGSAVPGFAEQKTGVLTATSTSYPHREKPSIFYEQEFPDSHLFEHAQKGSAVPGFAEQKMGVPTATSVSYPHREKPSVFSEQELPDSHLAGQAQMDSTVSGFAEQKTGVPTETSTTYPHRERTSVPYQQELPDSHLAEQAQTSSAITGFAEQKTGVPTATSTFYPHREKPSVFYEQEFPGSHVAEQAQKGSAVPEFAEQKTGVPTTASTSYPYREKPRVFYEPELPDSHLAEQAQKGSAVPGFAEQKTGVPTAPSASYPHREKPSDFYEQELLDSHLAEQAQKVSPVSGSAYQKSRIPVALPSSYSHRGKPSVFYQQKWPDSRLTEQAQHISALPGPVDQYTQRQTLPSSYYSHRQNPIILYQQELSDSHLTDEALKVSAVPGPADQKTETPIGFSRPYSLGEKPSIVYQQALTDSTLTEESLKVSSAPRPGDQKTGILTVPTSSDPHREQRSIFYQQAFPSHLPTEALEVSVVPGPAEKKGGLQSEAFSVYYSCREKPSSVYQQELPDSHLTEQAQKVSAAPGPANQKAGISTLPSTSYLHTEEPFIFYPQGLPDSQLFEEALKASAVSGPVDQKTGLPPTVYSTHYSNREKHIIFSPQALPDSHLLEEALEDSAVSEPVDQKTGLSSEPSSSYTQREKPIIFYPHGLAGSHVPEEALKVAAVSRTGDQKTCLPTVPSSSYLLGGKPIIFCQQALPDRHLTEEALNVSASPGPTDQKTGIPRVSSISYSQREKPFIFYQQGLPDSQPSVEALKVSFVPEPGDQKTRKLAVTSAAYSHGEKPIVSYQQELPSSHLTQEALKVSGVTGPADQKTGLLAVTSASDSYREKPIISYQQEFPDPNEDALKLLGSADQKTSLRIVSLPSCSHGKSPIFPYQELPDLTEEALKPFALPEPADQKTEISTGPSSSHSQKQRLRISAVILPDDQKTELPAALCSSYSYKEKPKNLTVIGPDDQTTPLLTVLHNSYSQREKPSIFFQQQLPDRHQSEDTLKISTVPEPADLNSGIPIPLSSSYSHREKSNVFYTKELPDKHLTEDAVKVSAIPGPAAQKIVLPVAPPISSSHREKPNTFCQQDLSDRHLIEDSLMFPSGVGQDDQITRLSTVPSATYSHSEKYKLISDHVQRLIDNLGSSNTGIILNNVPLNSQANERVVINKPESSGFEDVSSEEVQDTDSNSKTLKEIRTLLMEAENRALKRCNFPSPLVPFRDVSDISFIQSKKVVCFKEPPTTNESNGDLSQSQPFTEESPSSKCMQNDTSTQTNLKCQTGIENWEFSSTTVSNPLQEAENKATVAFDETLRQYKAAKSVMRSEPEGYSGLIGNKIVIPVMTIIKSDSNSDTSSCSWDSNSFESVSDVLLNFFPSASPKTSMTGSREEEGVSESDDGGGSSVDSLAAHVKNLLKCESSLNHAKQILRNAEEEESRVQARAWNMKFNLAHKCGYSISELNDDDRRKVEEIKENLFGHGRTTDLSKALRSPQGIGCKPEAVCSHIIIESHEKGCFRTLSAEQQQLDSHPCVFRSAEPSEIIRQQSPSSWRTRHINLSKSLDLNNPCFKVWNSLHLQSHSPFQNFTTDDFRINQSPQMPFHEKMDPWLAESVEPACVPPEEMDCHASSQMLPPEPMKKFTTSITFSSHRHSKCFSDSSVLKVGVAEGSQCTGASVGVFNSHFTEEQNPPRDLKQKTSSPSSFKIISQSPDKSVTILAESNKQSQKLPVEHSHQEEKLLEKSYYKGSHSEPNTSANYSNFKEVHFSDNHTLMSMGRPSSTLEVKEKTVTVTPDLSSNIFLEQQELFEQSKSPHADHHVRKHRSPPPQHQDYVVPNLPCRIFLEKRELFGQTKASHVDHKMRENYSPFLQGQDYIASDLPSSIFLEQRQLLQQSKAPDVDHCMRKHHSLLPQGQDCIIERNNQNKHKPHVADTINVEAKSNNVVSQSAPNQCTVVTSASTTPSNRKALSCFHITLCPKIPSKLDSGTLHERFHSLDPASKTRMDSEFNSDLQTVSSRSLEPASNLLTSKPIAQDQESLGSLGLKSSLDLQVIQSSLPDSKTISQDLKTIPFRNSQIVTSRQTQVNISDLEGYSNPDGTPVSADRSSEKIKIPFSAFSGKLSFDAINQITTEGPEKTMFSSEIFINAEDHGGEIAEFGTQKVGKVPVKFGSLSSVQQITVSRGTDGSKDAAAKEHSAQLENTKIESLPDTKAIKQKESHSKKAIPKEAWSEDKESLQTDIAESRRHSEFENTTHSVFRSAKFYIHRPVHLPSDQDFCHEFLGRSVFMRHSWKDLFQHHPDNQREHSCLPPSYQNVEKTKTDYTKIQSLSINVNLENKEEAKSQARDYPQSDKQLNDQNKDQKVTSEPPTRHTAHLNELWNKYQEQQKQQKKPEFGDRKELSLVERLDRLAKLLQNPITHSLLPSGRTQDDSRGERDVKEGSARLQQQKNKLQKKKRYKSLEKYHRNTRDLKKSKVFSAHQDWKSNQIKIEQIKFDKYILRKQPGFHYINTSSDSRQSEESELLTDTATNIISTTTSPVESDILTQTDKEVTLNDRSSSLSTIDTARLIQAFGHERVCLSPRQIRLYNSVTNHQRRYLEKRSKNKKAFYTCHPQMTSEHTRRKHIQVASHMISSDCISSSTSSFWNSNSTFCNNQNLHMLNKGVQAGHLEIVNGIRKHTRDVGMTFPTPSSSEARVEEDSDVTSSSEEKTEEKSLLTSYAGDKKLRKNKHSCCEGVSWFVPVENVKSVPKKENLPQCHGPGIAWFAPVTNTKPWREPLREQNWQGQHMDSRGSQAGHGRDPLKPFVRATLQESLQLHRPDFISRSGERIKRLKLIVQERKLQNVLQSEREALFNPVRAWPGCQEPMRPTPKRGFLAAQKNRPIGKKEMIQRSKRIYEQLPEVQKKREEEKRKSEYKSYRLRAQLYKKKVTNQLLGRKVPWD